jgi:hypothetical protein
MALVPRVRPPLRNGGVRPEDLQVSSDPLAIAGKTGLNVQSGQIYEEYLPELQQQPRRVLIYQQMADEDPNIAALLYAVVMLLRQVEWEVHPPKGAPDSVAPQPIIRAGKHVTEGTTDTVSLTTPEGVTTFLWQCLGDMSHTWDDAFMDWLTMLPQGWSFNEICYKERVGPNEPTGATRSAYTDKRLGWRKFELRAQESLEQWVFDAEGGLAGMLQRPAPTYERCFIPMEKALLFRTMQQKGNPEGRSLLRSAYRPWYLKRRIQNFEAVGVERDLAGIPVARIPGATLRALTTEHQNVVAWWQRLVGNLRNNENASVVIPSDRDTRGNHLFELELLHSGGTRQFNTDPIIERYNVEIMLTVLADWIYLGHQQTGSYALSNDKTKLFTVALEAFADSIANIFNDYAIPRLMRLNGVARKLWPTLVHGDIIAPSLSDLALLVDMLVAANAGGVLDPPLERTIRKAGNVPPATAPLDQQVESPTTAGDDQTTTQPPAPAPEPGTPPLPDASAA